MFWLDACLKECDVSGWFKDVLFDSVLQPLRSTAWTVTVARKLINYINLLKGRKYIFLVCGTQIFDGKNNTWIQSGKACFDCEFYLFFKFCWSGANAIVYTTKDLCPHKPANKKDVLPAFQQSNVIYQFSCHCDSRGRTFQRLQDRIKQHISKSIRNATCSQTRIQPKRDYKSSTQVPTIYFYLAILPSDDIFCAIPSVHKITMTNNFLFLPLPFTFICFRSHFH